MGSLPHQGHLPLQVPAALGSNPHNLGPSSGLLSRRGSWTQASGGGGADSQVEVTPITRPASRGLPLAQPCMAPFRVDVRGVGAVPRALAKGGQRWLRLRASGPPLARPLAEQEEAGSHATASGFPGKVSQPLGQSRGPALLATQSCGHFPATHTLMGRLPNELQAPVGPLGA